MIIYSQKPPKPLILNSTTAITLPKTVTGWLFLIYQTEQLSINSLLGLGLLWSSCEVCLPYVWAHSNSPSFNCFMLWLAGQLSIRLQGFIGAKLWPNLTAFIKCSYWQRNLLAATFNNNQLIALNSFVFNLKNLMINLIYRLITPLGFAAVAIITLYKLNPTTTITVAAWLIGHILITSLFSTKILKLAGHISESNLTLQTLERTMQPSENALLSLINTNNICYNYNKKANFQIEKILLIQSGWLASMIFVGFWQDPLVTNSHFAATVFIWLQLSNQIWNLSSNWHSLLQDYGGLLKLIEQI